MLVAKYGVERGGGLPFNLRSLMVVVFRSITRGVGMPFLITLVLMLEEGIVFCSGMTIGALRGP